VIYRRTVGFKREFRNLPGEIKRAVCVPHTEADHRELVELLDRITDEVGEDENHPLASLMDVLGVLIRKYEDENVPELTE
jgi:HTH-type transcriptional regulator / antitoxin HigA